MFPPKPLLRKTKSSQLLLVHPNYKVMITQEIANRLVFLCREGAFIQCTSDIPNLAGSIHMIIYKP